MYDKKFLGVGDGIEEYDRLMREEIDPDGKTSLEDIRDKWKYILASRRARLEELERVVKREYEMLRISYYNGVAMRMLEEDKKSEWDYGRVEEDKMKQ